MFVLWVLFVKPVKLFVKPAKLFVLWVFECFGCFVSLVEQWRWLGECTCTLAYFKGTDNYCNHLLNTFQFCTWGTSTEKKVLKTKFPWDNYCVFEFCRWDDLWREVWPMTPPSPIPIQITFVQYQFNAQHAQCESNICPNTMWLQCDKHKQLTITEQVRYKTSEIQTHQHKCAVQNKTLTQARPSHKIKPQIKPNQHNKIGQKHPLYSTCSLNGHTHKNIITYKRETKSTGWPQYVTNLQSLQRNNDTKLFQIIRQPSPINSQRGQREQQQQQQQQQIPSSSITEWCNTRERQTWFFSLCQVWPRLYFVCLLVAFEALQQFPALHIALTL